MNNTCTLYRFYHFITFSIPICSCNESCVYFVVCISCSVVYYRVYDSFYWTMHMRADSTYYRYVYTYMNVTSTFYKMIPMTHLMLGEKQGFYWYWRVRGIHVFNNVQNQCIGPIYDELFKVQLTSIYCAEMSKLPFNTCLINAEITRSVL